MATVFNSLLSGATALDILLAGRARTQDIAARQQVRLGGLLYSLAQGSSCFAHYQQTYYAGGESLQALPVTHKHTLMAHFDSWVTDPDVRLPDLQAFTADPKRIAEPYLGRYMVWESSGSSGQPAIFVQDAHCMAVYDALESLRRSPTSPLRRSADPLFLRERVAFVGVTGGHFLSVVQMLRMQEIFRWTPQTSCIISIMQPIEGVVAELNAYGPTVLATYPSVAIALAEQQAAQALRIAPYEVWTAGETLSQSAKSHIAGAFKCPVRNHYGASECLCIASECALGHLHANADWLILEAVDEHNHPVPAGQPCATTLLTNLCNRVQPIIRYDIGDQVSLSPEPCACGSALPVIQVSGRNDAPLKMRGRNGQQVLLLPLALTTALEEQAGVFDFQLRQHDAQTLELQVPHTGAQGEASLQRACAALTAFAEMNGVGPLHIITRQGVATPQGRSGKATRVIAA